MGTIGVEQAATTRSHREHDDPTLIVAVIAAGALYSAGASVATLIFVFAVAYMASMHLGYRGGHSGVGAGVTPGASRRRTQAQKPPSSSEPRRGTSATTDLPPTEADSA